MPNHFSTFSDQLKNVNNSLTQWKLLKNNSNTEKNLKKILKSVELLLIKFFHTVWNTIWVLNMKVMKILEMMKMNNKEKIQRKNKKENQRNQNQREKTQKVVNQKRNQNARINDSLTDLKILFKIFLVDKS